jgi:DNA polymerase sigma
MPRKYTDPYYPEISQQDFQNKLISDGVMEDLNDMAQNMESSFSESKYLRNAQVPVVKMLTCEAHGGFPVDVTAHDPRHQGLECVKLVRSLVDKYPALKPIVLVLKQLLNLTGLSDPYMGGLSSYGLVVMIVGYFQLLEFREFMRRVREQQGHQEHKSKGGWGEDTRQNYQRGNRRHSRRGSFANNPKSNKGSQKGFLNLNGHQLGSHSKISNNSKKRGQKSKSPGGMVNSQCLFNRSPENLGSLLKGLLYFFGFEFSMDFQKVSIHLEDEEPRVPIVSVELTRNSRAIASTRVTTGSSSTTL